MDLFRLVAPAFHLSLIGAFVPRLLIFLVANGTLRVHLQYRDVPY